MKKVLCVSDFILVKHKAGGKQSDDEENGRQKRVEIFACNKRLNMALYKILRASTLFGSKNKKALFLQGFFCAIGTLVI